MTELPIEAIKSDAYRLALLWRRPSIGDRAEAGRPWNGGTPDRSAVVGCERFLGRLWRLAATDRNSIRGIRTGSQSALDLQHETETDRFITDAFVAPDDKPQRRTVADAMAMTNGLYRYVLSETGAHWATLARATDAIILAIAPAAPEVTDRLWSLRHGGRSVHDQPVPSIGRPSVGGPAEHQAG